MAVLTVESMFTAITPVLVSYSNLAFSGTRSAVVAVSLRCCEMSEVVLAWWGADNLATQLTCELGRIKPGDIFEDSFFYNM